MSSPTSMRTWIALLAPMALGCGSSDNVVPFVLTIDSKDVVQSAVDQIRVNIAPAELSNSFAFPPRQSYATDLITTEVSPAGSFVIRIGRDYISANATPGTDSFRVELPMYSVGTTAEEVADPNAQVTFLSGEDDIATATLKLPWPLPEGDSRRVLVECDADAVELCMGGGAMAADGGV